MRGSEPYKGLEMEYSNKNRVLSDQFGLITTRIE